MRRKRSGSIYQDERGRWIAAIDVGDRMTGRKRKKFFGTSPEQVEAALAAWWSENREPLPDPMTRAERLDAARMLATHTPAEWYAKVRTYGGRCHYCHRRWWPLPTKDHMQPLSRGGSDGIDNVVPTCRACNQSKADMTAEAFIEWADATGYFGGPS